MAKASSDGNDGELGKEGSGTPDAAAEASGVSDVGVNGPPQPDLALTPLNLTNSWIRHADAKVGATLAVTTAVAVMLYNLVKDQNEPSLILSTLTVLCSAAAFLAGGSAALALIPRLSISGRRPTPRGDRDRSGDEASPAAAQDSPNLLFFADVAKHYEGNASGYADALRSLTSDPELLVRQIAHQAHANATVAHHKFVWADRAVKSLVAALAFIGLVAITVGSAR